MSDNSMKDIKTTEVNAQNNNTGDNKKRKNIRKSDLINTKIPCAGSTYKRRTVQGIFLRESIINQLADIFLFNSSYLSDRQYHLL